ncbi:hypothetical protein DAPPUDRAFT_270491 [Daphnia pulex]|uniref:Uncharacterized protein n=1 Tax=Daphnia pulex TaxID=6669 RepID=E9I0T5_DAPPU|nr:hypothetical protein DAPPUDRAFT_270491 [Daphnia pulex]|eukprot:EFX62393.1 hypothetical protein DAPPUDRAFT_270491 [Daphnia pulex]
MSSLKLCLWSIGTGGLVSPRGAATKQPGAVQEEVVRDVGEDVAKTLAEDEKTTQELMDLEFARQLQQEEERQAAEAETVERETAAASSQSQLQSAHHHRLSPQRRKTTSNSAPLSYTISYYSVDSSVAKN